MGVRRLGGATVTQPHDVWVALGRKMPSSGPTESRDGARECVMARRQPNPSAQTSAQASNLYQAVGGTAACRKLSALFYARVEQDPLLRPLFPGKTLKCAVEELAAFLTQFLGGPNEDAQRRWWLSLRESHLRFAIGPKERDAWMKNMLRALDEERTDPPEDHIHREIVRRWDAQRGLDEAVTAIRRGDAHGAIVLAESSTLQA